MVTNETLTALALCVCGHGIAKHDGAGCPGARATFCMCTRTPAAALDAAIEKIRAGCLTERRIRKARHR